MDKVKKMTPRMAKTTIRLPEFLLKKAKHHAVYMDMDLQDIVANALREYFAENDKALDRYMKEGK